MRYARHMKIRQISVALQKEDGRNISPAAVHQWLNKYENKGEEYVYSNTRPGNSRQTVVREDHVKLIDQCMNENPERSSTDLHQTLIDRTGTCLSSSYIRKLRSSLGWTYKKTSYCQLVRDANKPKRLEWAQQQIARNETFDDVIFTDESSFEAQRTVGYMYYKKGQAPPLRPKPKHPIKVLYLLHCIFLLLLS